MHLSSWMQACIALASGCPCLSLRNSLPLANLFGCTRWSDPSTRRCFGMIERRLHGLVWSGLVVPLRFRLVLARIDQSVEWETKQTTLNGSNHVVTEEDGDEEVVDDGLYTCRSVLDAWMDGAKDEHGMGSSSKGRDEGGRQTETNRQRTTSSLVQNGPSGPLPPGSGGESSQ